MVHYYIELALFALMAYLLGCTLGAAWRKYASGPSAQGAAMASATTAHDANAEFAMVNPAPGPALPSPAPITTSIRQHAPVLPPTHPSFPRAGAESKVEAKMVRPRGLTAPRAGTADDLKRIVGVGPKYEKTLHNLGLYHFDQVASLTQEQAAWVDDHLRFEGRMEREEWIEQARLLAEGDTEQFNKIYGQTNPETSKPKGIAAARSGKADDLKRISGIGPKNEKVLHGLGIFHFDQIAGWSEDEMAWVDSHLKFNGRIAREEWTRQAKLLADGNESEFKSLYGTGGMKDTKGETQSGARTRKG
jgi:predicted flap endonuclease-1-like 5' DNA nuclease